MNEDHMHGSMFVLLKRFVENTYEYSMWVRLLEEAEVEHLTYRLDEMYPTHEIFAIVSKLGEKDRSVRF